MHDYFERQFWELFKYFCPLSNRLSFYLSIFIYFIQNQHLAQAGSYFCCCSSAEFDGSHDFPRVTLRLVVNSLMRIYQINRSLAEPHWVTINRVVQPKPPLLKALPLTGALHHSGPPHPLWDGGKRAKLPLRRVQITWENRTESGGISVYKCAAPLQSSSTEAVYTVNKQTQVAGAILFLTLHSSGKEWQLQRCRAQAQRQQNPPFFVFLGGWWKGFSEIN